MLRVGRSVLFVLSFLSLQLSLISGGERCTIVPLFAENGTGMAGMDMAGMDMAGMDMAGMDMASHHGDGQSDGPSPRHDEQSCDDQGTSAGCDSMTACVFAAVLAPTSIRQAERLPVVRPPMFALRTPPTEGAAPELPPPRLQS